MIEPKPKPPASLLQATRAAVAAVRPAHRDEDHAERPAHRIAPNPVPPPRVRVKHRPKARPSRPVSALAPFWPSRPESGYTVGSRSPADALDPAAFAPFADAGTVPRLAGPKTFYKPAVPAPVGPEAMIAYLNRRGIRLIPTIDGQFATVAEGGGLSPGLRNAVEAARPLLRAYLHGSPLHCALSAHVGGTPPLATTIAVGGASWCGACSVPALTDPD